MSQKSIQIYKSFLYVVKYSTNTAEKYNNNSNYYFYYNINKHIIQSIYM